MLENDIIKINWINQVLISIDIKVTEKTVTKEKARLIFVTFLIRKSPTKPNMRVFSSGLPN